MTATMHRILSIRRMLKQSLSRVPPVSWRCITIRQQDTHNEMHRSEWEDTQVSSILVAVAAFLASAVEMVEALTIVLAVGVTREWRSTLIGLGAALVALAVITAALGPALVLIPIDALRLVVGGLLLVFGLQWLRKAILRSSGYKALHDEAAIFMTEREAAGSRARDTRHGLDWYAFTVSFKGVLLEGLEVA